MQFVILRRRMRRASGIIFAFSIFRIILCGVIHSGKPKRYFFVGRPSITYHFIHLYQLIFFVLCLLYISYFSSSLGYQQNSISESINYNKNEETTSTKHAGNGARKHKLLQEARWVVPSNNKHDGKSNFWHLDTAGDPERALDSIQYLNLHHEVLNQQKFGPLDANSIDFILVVQLHDRIEYLKYLVGSLSRSKGIDRVILVFSYDLNSDSNIELIQSIDFCRVIHIFFPFNTQLFPNIYPGRSSADCPEGAKKSDGVSCADEDYPDTHGHYRIPRLSQIKHHWWWKANYVFEEIVHKYELEDKLVVMLEEDHMVTPDFLHTLKLMHKKRQKICPDCELLCLGTYPKSFNNYEQDIRKLGIEIWYSSKFNMGMALNAELWKKIQNCHEFYCSYDDYNWDWTLLQLSVKCLPSKMRVIYTKAPRVIHIGDCGVHTHRCTADKAVHETLKLFERVNSSFYPSGLEVSEVTKRMLKPSKPNGGWGDPRDRQLCKLNTHPGKENAAEVLKISRGAIERQKQMGNKTVLLESTDKNNGK